MTASRARRGGIAFRGAWDALLSWARLAAHVHPVYPTGARGRPPFSLALLLRIHCGQLL
ncbi:MAG: hypothetical protein OXG33_06445 [Chloroflexi bacterium]|nr:hypothetical protein [Chloroflexota bacterium]